MSNIYSKTVKGQEEIKSRASGLSQRMRQVLIFIDGKRSRDELVGMLKGDDMDALLATLVAQGLAEVSGNATTRPAGSAPAAAVAAAAVAAASAAAAASTRPMSVAPQAAAPDKAALERRQRDEEAQAELLMARSFMGRMS